MIELGRISAKEEHSRYDNFFDYGYHLVLEVPLILTIYCHHAIHLDRCKYHFKSINQ